MCLARTVISSDLEWGVRSWLKPWNDSHMAGGSPVTVERRPLQRHQRYQPLDRERGQGLERAHLDDFRGS
jgi:antirestriction protein ArdC